MANTCNPSTQEAEARGWMAMSSRLVWTTLQNPVSERKKEKKNLHWDPTLIPVIIPTLASCFFTSVSSNSYLCQLHRLSPEWVHYSSQTWRHFYSCYWVKYYACSFCPVRLCIGPEICCVHVRWEGITCPLKLQSSLGIHMVLHPGREKYLNRVQALAAFLLSL